MKSIKIVLLAMIAFTSFGLVGCVSHTHERVIERDTPGVVIEKGTPTHDTTVNVRP